MVILDGNRVVLREHEVRDLEAVLEYAADPLVARYVPWEPNTPSMARQFITQAMDDAAERPRMSYVFAVVERGSNQVIGATRIGIESEAHRRADIGYVFRRDRWGQGFATEAARIVVGFGFRDLDMYRIWGTTHPENRASSRVLEQIGMKYEGRIRGHMFVKGAWRDSLAYSILRPDWVSEESA